MELSLNCIGPNCRLIFILSFQVFFLWTSEAEAAFARNYYFKFDNGNRYCFLFRMDGTVDILFKRHDDWLWSGWLGKEKLSITEISLPDGREATLPSGMRARRWPSDSKVITALVKDRGGSIHTAILSVDGITAYLPPGNWRIQNVERSEQKDGLSIDARTIDGKQARFVLSGTMLSPTLAIIHANIDGIEDESVSQGFSTSNALRSLGVPVSDSNEQSKNPMPTSESRPVFPPEMILKLLKSGAQPVLTIVEGEGQSIRQIVIEAPKTLYRSIPIGSHGQVDGHSLETNFPPGLWMGYSRLSANKLYFTPFDRIPKEIDLAVTGDVEIWNRPWSAPGSRLALFYSADSATHTKLTAQTIHSDLEKAKTLGSNANLSPNDCSELFELLQ